MPPDLRNDYCCCQVFYIYHGIYLIAVHCLLQATYAVGIFVTSYHKPRNNALIFCATGSYACLVPVGILVFWANLYENWRGAKASGILLTLITIINTVVTAVYLFWYGNFKANSLLDKVFFWGSNDDWISSNDLPFTFWHILTIQLFIFNLIWFYYSIMMCRLGTILKANSK